MVSASVLHAVVTFSIRRAVCLVSRHWELCISRDHGIVSPTYWHCSCLQAEENLAVHLSADMGLLVIVCRDSFDHVE